MSKTEKVPADQRATRSLVRRMMIALDYADDVFAENCDCGQCGPCRKRRHFKKLMGEAEDYLYPSDSTEETT